MQSSHSFDYLKNVFLRGVFQTVKNYCLKKPVIDFPGQPCPPDIHSTKFQQQIHFNGNVLPGFIFYLRNIETVNGNIYKSQYFVTS